VTGHKLTPSWLKKTLRLYALNWGPVGAVNLLHDGNGRSVGVGSIVYDLEAAARQCCRELDHRIGNRDFQMTLASDDNGLLEEKYGSFPSAGQ
jgi:hypothetical protein